MYVYTLYTQYSILPPSDPTRLTCPSEATDVGRSNVMVYVFNMVIFEVLTYVYGGLFKVFGTY